MYTGQALGGIFAIPSGLPLPSLSLSLFVSHRGYTWYKGDYLKHLNSLYELPKGPLSAFAGRREFRNFLRFVEEENLKKKTFVKNRNDKCYLRSRHGVYRLETFIYTQFKCFFLTDFWKYETTSLRLAQRRLNIDALEERVIKKILSNSIKFSFLQTVIHIVVERKHERKKISRGLSRVGG